MTNNQTDKTAFTELIIDDVVYKTTLNKMHRNRKAYQPIDPRMVKSFMPGNIQEVFVKAGDHVTEGEKLCILEAMKMKNIIVAPYTGVVKSVNVQIGDKVPKHQVLVELE